MARNSLLMIGMAVMLAIVSTPARAESPDKSGLDHLLNDPRLQELGEKIFFDESLSRPRGQSCASCHDPKAGWSGPDGEINNAGGVYEGAVKGRFGNRKPTSAAYATWSPTLYLLGNPAADQAQGPFLIWPSP